VIATLPQHADGDDRDGACRSSDGHGPSPLRSGTGGPGVSGPRIQLPSRSPAVAVMTASTA
jgi:hypothetical protein